MQANLPIINGIPKIEWACRRLIFFKKIYRLHLRMLTKDELLFINYWEKNRDKKKHFLSQLLYGLPRGLMFALPVLVALIFHNWYKSMVYISGSQVVVITICVLGIAVFFGVFREKFTWENNEQLYRELKLREQKEDAAHI